MGRFKRLDVAQTLAILEQGYTLVVGGGSRWLKPPANMRSAGNEPSHRTVITLHKRKLLEQVAQSTSTSFRYGQVLPDWVEFTLARKKGN